MPDTKTPEEILRQHYDFIAAANPEHNWGPWEDDHLSVCIGINAMQEYASQESRSTAVDLLNWVSKNNFQPQSSNQRDPQLWENKTVINGEELFSRQLYDLYLQSLTNQNKGG